jgi:hypothetical protein
MAGLRWFSLSIMLVAVSLASACANPRTLLRLYDGPILPREQIVTLLYPTDMITVLNIDERMAGRSCLSGCDFRQPVQITPGRHRFVSRTLVMDALPKDHTSNPIPAGAAVLKPEGGSLLSWIFSFDFEAELQAGKTYALRYGYTDPQRRPQTMHIWWNEMPNVPVE